MRNDFPWRDRYDSGVPYSLPVPDLPFHRLLEQAAESFPGRPGLIAGGTTHTYSAIARSVSETAAALIHAGLKPGARLGLLLPNSAAYCVTFYAGLKAGLIIVPLPCDAPVAEIARRINAAAIETIVAEEHTTDTLVQVMAASRLRAALLVGPERDSDHLLSRLRSRFQARSSPGRDLPRGFTRMRSLIAQAGNLKPVPLHSPSSNDRAAILIAEGSGGAVKPAVHTHRSLVAGALQIQAWLGTASIETGVVSAVSSLSEPFGLIAGLGLAAISGATLVLPDGRIPTGRQLRRHRVSIMTGIPENEPDLSGVGSLLQVLTDSSPGVDRKIRLPDAAALVRTFGMPEAPVLFMQPREGSVPAGTIGLPLPDVEVRIVDASNRMTVLSGGELGELVVRGPQVTSGYFGLPLETGRTLKEGWFYTGVRARLDAEGFVFPG